MTRKYTQFEQAVIASIVWQVKGFKEKQVPKSATSRILRASLRRISHDFIGTSIQVKVNSIVEFDHAVPVSVISDILLKMDDASAINVMATIEKYLISARLTQDEHRVQLKNYASVMPEGWDPHSKDPKNYLARYTAVGIVIDETKRLTDPSETPVNNADMGELSRAHREENSQKRFPLRQFYQFAEQNDLTAEATAIKETSVPHAVEERASTLRRGLAISLLEQEALLDSFILRSWEFGLTPKGRSEITNCQNFARRFETGEWDT